MTPFLVAVIVIAAVPAAVVLLHDFNLWFQAFMSETGIGFADIFTMRFRKVNATAVVHANIMAQ